MTENYDDKINAAVVAIKKQIDHVVQLIEKDNERLLKENYEMSRRIEKLEKQFMIHHHSILSGDPTLPHKIEVIKNGREDNRRKAEGG